MVSDKSIQIDKIRYLLNQYRSIKGIESIKLLTMVSIRWYDLCDESRDLSKNYHLIYLRSHLRYWSWGQPRPGGSPTIPTENKRFPPKGNTCLTVFQNYSSISSYSSWIKTLCTPCIFLYVLLVLNNKLLIVNIGVDINIYIVRPHINRRTIVDG